MSSSKNVINAETLIREIKKSNPKSPNFSIENIIYAGKTKEMRKLIDQLYIQNGLGAVKSGITRSLYGVNFAGTPNMMPVNRDSYGFTFFTKPLMNMSDDNLRNDRILSQLLNKDPNSIHRLIRCSLDSGILHTGNDPKLNGWKSPFINPNSAFIPILSNNLLSMSGWPDMDSQTFTSGSGNWREEFSFVDGIVKDYRTWDATCSFRNIDGNLILNMFFYWVLYQAGVAAVGNLMPYPIMNLSHEIDYQTAIYRLITDQTRTKLTGIARTIAYPLSVPIGRSFDFDAEQVYNTEHNQVSISFRCAGAEYNDDILISEFNRVVELHDPDFRGERRLKNYLQLPPSLYRLFNGMAQPRINTHTYDIEWWVSKTDLERNRALITQSTMEKGQSKPFIDQLNQLNKRG